MASGFDVAVYVTDLLKYAAVPAAAFEFLKEEKRNCVENWIFTKLPKLLSVFAITLLVFAVVFLILIYGQKWIVAGFLGLGVLFYILSQFSEGSSVFSEYFVPVLVTALVFAAIEYWVLPESWIDGMAQLIEFTVGNLSEISFLESVMPPFDSQNFVTEYRSFFEPFDIFKQFSVLKVYIFSTHGFMLLLILLLDLAIIASFLSFVGLVIFFPFHLFIRLSKWLNKRFSLTESNVPLGAFFLWGIGETAAIGLIS